MTIQFPQDILRAAQPHLATEYGVRRIGLFGSYGKGTSNEDSDVDILVEFDHPLGFRFIEFAEYLESLLGRKVDILTPAGLESIRIPSVANEIRETVVYVG